jgi:hypothetical protein
MQRKYTRGFANYTVLAKFLLVPKPLATHNLTTHLPKATPNT